MPDSPPHPAMLAAPPDGVAFPDHRVAMLETADGYRLRAAFFPPPGEARPCGTVLILQGRAEFIEKYREVIGELRARGFAVASFDWRGQGGSERLLARSRSGHVEDFDDYRLDLAAMIAAMRVRDLPRPWVMLAHSTGGCIALHEIACGSEEFRRAILTAPLVGIAGPGGGRVAQIASRLFSALGFATWRIPFGTAQPRTRGPFKDNPFTQDPARYEEMRRWLTEYPDLGIGDPTIGWVAAAFHALDPFGQPGFGRQGRVPLLMLLAGADRVVSNRRAEVLAQVMRGASAIVLPGARHEILMERDETRALFWAAFDAFVPVEGE